MRVTAQQAPNSITVDSEQGTEAIAEPAPPVRRLPWSRPRLECFGDVRQVTMGGSLGLNESGNPSRFP